MAANFEYYKIFYYVAKYQNFTLAAKALLSSQPSVSRCMQALETELGCRLFVRTKRGVSLTAEGEQLYKYVAPPASRSLKVRKISAEPSVIRMVPSTSASRRPPSTAFFSKSSPLFTGSTPASA